MQQGTTMKFYRTWRNPDNSAHEMWSWTRAQVKEKKKPTIGILNLQDLIAAATKSGAQ